jgi:hypothetical protein
VKTACLMAFASALFLVSCGDDIAKLDGPFTQAKLDEIQSGCGMTAAKLTSANPGEAVKISVEGLTLDAPDAVGVNLLLQSKCLQDKLTALGVNHEVTAPMISSDMQKQFDDAIDNATVIE